MFRKQIFAFLSVILFAGLSLSGPAQTSISGTVNKYIDVVSIDGADRLTVSDASEFSDGDTVLVVQMKGIEIDTTQTATNYGTLSDKFQSGKYEFIIISTVIGNQVVFSADLTNTYDINGMIQLVRVASYDNAVVVGEVTCQPWDPALGYGGIIAIIVGNTLSLNDNINATGKGFKGGAISNGDGLCSIIDGSYLWAYFDASSLQSGYKGEGPTTYESFFGLILDSSVAKGRGANFTGGGGGNALNSGGGGGALIGNGGYGGIESSLCVPNQQATGGVGGKTIEASTDWKVDNRIYLGSGGGTGTQFGGKSATPGGNGGGIVIIIADTLVGNSNSIFSNGESVSLVATAGAGGGGSGGTVLLSVTEYRTTLNVEVKGGDGGNTNDPVDCSGAGGAGGGGLLWYANTASVSNVSSDVSQGNIGLALTAGCGGNSGTVGSDGKADGDLNVPLTGFLFNNISSSVTSVRTDTICEGDIAPPLIGTFPKGGIQPYNFEWESSTDKAVWTLEGQGPLFQNFTPTTPLVDTTYYRRTVYDFPIPQIVDVSKVITIIVQPKIIDNIMAVDDTVCSNIQPDTIFATPILPSGGNGPGSYAYIWEESIDGGTNWNPVAGGTDYYFEPPVRVEAAIKEYQYRRIVSSGIGCPDTSNTAILTYLPALTNGIGTDQEICDNQDPAGLTNISLSGGTGVWIYSWQESTDGINYGGTIATTQSYDPPVISHGTAITEHRFYRRTVTSSVCIDSGAVVDITVYPLISNNLIGNDETICVNTAPAQLTGAIYGGGDGTYSFEWIKSDDMEASYITTGITSESYDPGPLTIAHHFKRVITSNACTDTSAAPVFIDIRPVFNATISDLSGGRDTICEGGTGQVEIFIDDNSSTDWTVFLTDDGGKNYAGINFTTTLYIASITPDSPSWLPGSGDLVRTLNISTISDQWGCAAATISGIGSIVIQKPPVALPGTGGDICGLVTTLAADPPYSNAESSGLWTGPAGLIFSDATSATSDVDATTLGEGPYTLTWTVSNGRECPQDQANLDLQFWEVPSPALIIKPSTSDTVLTAFANTVELEAQTVTIGTKQWSSSGPAVFTPSDSEVTTATNLDWGGNTVQFKVSNGTCPDEIATINVQVQDNPFIPQGISPRISIGQNDFFVIENIGNVPNELSIFTRAGNIVFQTENFMTADNFPNGWDGTDKNGSYLPDDTYYYVVTVKTDIPRTFTGYIIIKGGQ